MTTALLEVGGVWSTQTVAEDAVDVLQTSPGIMVRQPLVRARNPLYAADYHLVAAPYKPQFQGERAKTKLAFVFALTVLISGIRDVDVMLEVVDRAMVAFASDASYFTAMARAAVGVHHKRQVWDVRGELRQAASTAEAECRQHTGEFLCLAEGPCGTGPDCRYSNGDLRLLQVESVSGKSQRPPNHVGGSYSIEDAVRPLIEVRPAVFGG